MISDTELMPDVQIIKTMITAYTHSGDINKAKLFWQNQVGVNDEFKYDNFVVTAMVDCYSRNGYLKDAYQLILNFVNMIIQIILSIKICGFLC